MKRTLDWTRYLAVALVLLGLVGVASADAARSLFTGRWVSTDIDGSSQQLMIGGGPDDNHRMRLYDDEATIACSDFDDSPAIAQGEGVAAGNVLTGNWDVYCLTAPRTFVGNFGFAFTYDAASDTLTDTLGVIWSRR